MTPINDLKIVMVSVTSRGPHPTTQQCIDQLRSHGVVWVHRWGSSDLPMARSRAFDEALQQKADLYLSIDGDMAFAPIHVQRIATVLTATQMGAVGAFYMKRGKPEISFRPFKGLDCKLGAGAAVSEVSGVGLGFTAFTAKAFEAAREHAEVVEADGSSVTMWCAPFSKRGVWYPDDFSLCWRIRKAGLKVGVDLSCVVRHIGEHPCDYADSVLLHLPNATKFRAKSYELKVEAHEESFAARLAADLD